MNKVRKNGSKWTDEQINLFISLWECGMPGDSMSGMFDLQDKKSVRGTLSKFKSYGYL